MADVTLNRIGELLRGVLELLWTRPEGMPAREVLAFLPEVVELTEHERGFSPGAGAPRYERLVRLATLPLVKAGWLVKTDKGRWFLTEDGRQAARVHAGAAQLYQEAVRLFDESRQGLPSYSMVVEEAEERSWEQIRKYLLDTQRTEFRRLVAELLHAMGYHVSWVAPPEKDHGQIDLIAHTDPLGVRGARILVQVKHKGQPVTREGAASFLSLLGGSDYGLFVSSGGFTAEVLQQIRSDPAQRTTLLDLESFFDQWIEHYDRLSDEAKRRLPLKPIYFLHGVD